MARRTGERLSAGMGFRADGSVNDEETGRESWLCRSTVCVNQEDDSDHSDADECKWTALHTPALAAEQRGVTGTLSLLEAIEDDGMASTKVIMKRISSESQIKKGKRSLPSLRGFSNAEALRAQLPRATAQKTEVVDGHSRQKDDTKIKKSSSSDVACGVSPSMDEVAANRRKWDLERKLRDEDRDNAMAGKVTAKRGYQQNPKRKLPMLNPVTTSVLDDEENRLKWDFERKLQDSTTKSVGIGEIEAQHRKRDRIRKLPMLNPGTSSVAEAEENQRKWDLERKLQDFERCGFVDTIGERMLTKKLPRLNPKGVVSVSVAGRRNNADLDRKFKSSPSNCVSASIGINSGQQELRKKLAEVQDYRAEGRMKRLLRGLKSWLGYDSQRCEDDNVKFLQSSCPIEHRRVGDNFQISAWLSYLILFSSSAVLHCAIFYFSAELRQFLGLDTFPLGLLVLASWVCVGVISCVGGVVGDVVFDRVRLLHRIVIVWGVGVVTLHIAANQLSSLVSSVSLAAGMLCASVGHGFLSTNVVALYMEANCTSLNTIPTPLPSGDEDDGNYTSDGDDGGNSSYCSSSDEDSSTESETSYLSEEYEHQRQDCDLVSHKFLSGCFAAQVMGSTLVQGYYILVVGINTDMDEGSLTTATGQGLPGMVVMSFVLMASLVYFCFETWDCRQSPDNVKDSSPTVDFDEQRLEHKLASLERGFSSSVKILRWRSLFLVSNRALVSYVLIIVVLIMLIGIGLSVIAMLMAQASLLFRLVAFLLVLLGWLLSMVASSRQLNPKKRGLVRECRRAGLRSRHLYLALFGIAFICVSGCVAFLRAQLYSSMVVQVCQTQLAIPGAGNTLFEPELLGTIVGVSSLLFLAIRRGFSRGLPTADVIPSSPLTKASLFAQETPPTPMYKARPQPLSSQKLPNMASYPPVARMCFAVLLCLVSAFLLSVVELYRRKASVAMSLPPRNCGAMHSEFSFLWTLPHLVLLGVSDTLFRVSLQEECYELARYTFAPVETSSSASRRWLSTVQGVVLLAEALGYTAALALTALLSEWLFHPEVNDMALLFLLLTAIVALTYALLKRIAARTKAHQRHYSSR